MDEGDGQEPGAPGGGDREGPRPTEPGAVLRVPGPVQGKGLVFTPHVNLCLLTRLGLIISIADNKVIVGLNSMGFFSICEDIYCADRII